MLYNNADYELQLPGMPKVEEGMSALASDSHHCNEEPVVPKPTPKRGRQNAGDAPRGAKKRKGHPHLEEMMQQEQVVMEQLQPVQEMVVQQNQMMGGEHLYADDSVLQLGAEQEVPMDGTGDDDAPPVLAIPSGYDHRLQMVDDNDELAFGDEEDDFLDGRPPDLEVNL